MNTIIGVIIVRTLIEWSTVSITTPYVPYGEMTYLVHRTDSCNQIGREVEVTYARFDYQGMPIEVELGRKENKTAKMLERSVPCQPGEQIWSTPKIMPLR